MILPVLILLAVSIGLPLAYVLRVLRFDGGSRADWLIEVAEAAAVLLLVLVVGRWDIAGAWLRWVLVAIFVVAVLVSWRRHAGRWASTRERRGRLAKLIPLALLGVALAYVFAGMRLAPAPRDLAFPLEGGWFMVGQGGGNRLLNHHAGHPAQGHAADITALNAAGYRAAGVYPSDPARYAAFGARVVSPCAGEVASAIGDLPDLDPPETDRENPAGNHVVVDCGDDVLVELAHLRQGSLLVAAGDAVAVGMSIGEVGNSGNTTEPHLHVHAVDAAGAAVAVTFDGVAPVRNRSFQR